MGKLGTVRNIPLQAELCLNKQKVDITDFNGWRECNAPVYGGCLSPLYKKKNTRHDLFIGNDYYDIADGVLSKNGEEVLSGENGKFLQKEKIAEDYDCLTVTEDNQLTWIKVTGSNSFRYSIDGGTAQTVTLENCIRIVATKTFGDSQKNTFGCIVWYLDNTDVYKYRFLCKRHDGISVTVNGTIELDVTNPLIQCTILNNTYTMVSFYGASGVGLDNIPVKSIVVNVDTSSAIDMAEENFEAIGMNKTIYDTIKTENFASATVKTYYQKLSTTFSEVGYDYLVKVRQTVKIDLTQPADVDIDVSMQYSMYDEYSIGTIESGERSVEIELF